MNLKEQYPRLADDHDLKAVIEAVLQKHGIVPDSGIVSDLTQATETFVHGQYGAAVNAALGR